MGAPRSGTTLLASLLASRNDAIALPEMHYMHDLLRQEIVYKYVSREKVKNALKNHFMFLGLNIVSSRRELEKIVENTVLGTIKNIIESYNKQYYNKTCKYWIEHTPHNYEYFNVLFSSFKNAKFIHIVRDGRAVYRSEKNVDWSYKDVIRSAKNWKKKVEKCLILEKAFYKRVKTVKYEELTTNTKNVLKSLCLFLGINFEETMLEGKGVRRPIYAKYAKSLGQRANDKSNYLWKKELKAREISHFTKYNYDLLKYLGYPTEQIGLREIKGLKKRIILLNGKIKASLSSRKAKRRFRKVLNNKLLF